MAKINQEWRSILRNIKCVELRNEAKNVQTYFADAFQRKNQTINRLLSELDQQEEMYATLLNSHMDSINNLIGIHFNESFLLLYVLCYQMNFFMLVRTSRRTFGVLDSSI